MKLNFNDFAMRRLASSQTPDKEGRLLYRDETMSRGRYKEYWFCLINNLLFYFKTNECGKATGSEPVGVLVLVNHEAAHEEEYVDRPFVFSINFISTSGAMASVKQYFSGSSKENCQAWVDAIRNVDYARLRARLDSLRKRIELVTGSDPVSTRPKLIQSKNFVSKSRNYLKSTSARSDVGSCKNGSDRIKSDTESMQSGRTSSKNRSSSTFYSPPVIHSEASSISHTQLGNSKTSAFKSQTICSSGLPTLPEMSHNTRTRPTTMKSERTSSFFVSLSDNSQKDNYPERQPDMQD